MDTMTTSIVKVKKYFFKESKDRWSGPTRVTGQEASKIRIIHTGYDRTVAACRVSPMNPETTVVEEVEDRPGMEEPPKPAQGMDGQSGMENEPVPARGLEDHGGMKERLKSSQRLDSQRDLDEGIKTSRRLDQHGMDEAQIPSKRLEAEHIELDHANAELRPKRNQIVEFKVGGVMKIGKVSKVGKGTGR